MFTTKDFVTYLQAQFPTYPFYNGVIDRSKDKAIGLYLRSAVGSTLALGGKDNTSYSVLPLNMLVHWTQNSSECENVANEIYEFLWGKSNVTMGLYTVPSIHLLDSSPINIQRDERNICEMTMRIDITYNR